MKPYIVLLPIQSNDRRQEAEHVEATKWESFQEFVNNNKCTGAAIYGLSDFMDICNDQEINLENYWVSYIYVKDTRL